jgi:hypothetical protein
VGGAFEIWDKQMTAKVHSFVPLFNRMAIFSTGSDTYHGNPDVVAHPSGDPRLSIALYYYTATWDDTRVAHMTLFKARPGSADRKTDYKAMAYQAAQEILPPILFRNLLAAVRRGRG